MRQINSHKINPANDKLEIYVLDEPGQGGANHEYSIIGPDKKTVGEISFQNGPIAEHGVNGVTQEVLLAILIDRLESFQKGPFTCKENSVALTYLQTARLWLFSRTLDRMQKGVEGTNQKRPEDGSPSPTPPAPPAWPPPPHLRMPRLVADAGFPVRSTGTDDKGNYYEDFYDDRPVFRDHQGYFQIDDGAVHVSYLNLPGASIEHRLVPRPSAGASLENVP